MRLTTRACIVFHLVLCVYLTKKKKLLALKKKKKFRLTFWSMLASAIVFGPVDRSTKQEDEVYTADDCLLREHQLGDCHNLDQVRINNHCLLRKRSGISVEKTKFK